MNNTINIIGSGLSGPLLATMLAKKHNCYINMYERSSDCRESEMYSGRSINLALSERGINALKYVGVFDEYFKSLLIPMYGRTIHYQNGTTSFQPYSNRKEHFINSISRKDINEILLDASEKTNKVKIMFNKKCTKVDFKKNNIHFENSIIHSNSPIIGADGYKSVVAMEISNNYKINMDYVDIEHSYKELTIKAKNNKFQLDPNSLHIWPRRDMMMIALPNKDKSFTCTLFMKSIGENSFESIQTDKELVIFFEENFKDLISKVDNLSDSYFNNPVGKLIGLQTPKWYYKNKALIIGDAAHATVPFYGQGMNAAFEDCYIFSNIIKKNEGFDNWQTIFSKYEYNRKKDADTVLKLSMDNYKIMRNDVLDENFLMKQKTSFLLNKKFPNQFIPLYTMISFTNIPYYQAFQRHKIQENILNELLNYDFNNYDELKLEEFINKNLDKITYN